MKKLLLLAFTLCFLVSAYAITHKVQVSNYQFSPASINANVGDTIEWTWVSGFHTTTSTSVPGGAATWDAQMTSTNTSYKYKLTTAGTYSYYCSIHPSMLATLNVSAVLPVTLTAFSVAPAGKNAAIQWSTSNEQNIAAYLIKRSNDGVNFAAIGQVNAIDKATLNTYNFTDNAVTAGDKYLYYYIEIVDKNGAHTQSAIQPFKNAFAKSNLLHQVSPNPVVGTDHLMLQFYADKPGKMLTQLYTSAGALVKQAQMSAVEGINNAHFHTGTLAVGTYVLRCTLGDIRETRQVIVQ